MALEEGEENMHIYTYPSPFLYFSPPTFIYESPVIFKYNYSIQQTELRKLLLAHHDRTVSAGIVAQHIPNRIQ